MIGWQDMAVFGVVLGATVFLVRHLWRRTTRVRTCGRDMPCKGVAKQPQTLISIDSDPARKTPPPLSGRQPE